MRKLGRATDKRNALLKNQVSNLLWRGEITTTYARAKEMQKLAEKYITLAVNTYKDIYTVNKVRIADGKQITVEVQNDGPQKLAARRMLMANLNDLKEEKGAKESKGAYKLRTQDVKHPLFEKIFNVYAPKYAERAESNGQKGGYTAVYKLGPRKGDAAEMAKIVLL